MDRARKRYIQDYRDEDNKTFWKKLEELMPSKNTSNSINLIHQETGLPISLNDTAEHINNYFVGIGPKFASNFNIPWTYAGTTTHFEIPEFIITPETILTAAKYINIKKSSAIPYVSSKVIKDAFLAIPDKFAYLFNLSLVSSTFPTAWKKAIVTPLPKPGDRANVSNYRPHFTNPIAR